MSEDNQLDRIEQLLQRALEQERERMESRLTRLESLMSQAGPLTLEHGDRIRRLEDVAIQSEEYIQNNASSISQLTDIVTQYIQASTTYREGVEADRQRFEEHQRTTEAALAKIDRVLDYLISRDAPDSPDGEP